MRLFFTVRRVAIGINFLVLGIIFSACGKEPILYSENRTFETSFEEVDDFEDFYITPQDYMGTSFHELSDSIVHSGDYAHKAWIKGTNPSSTLIKNNNHRGYPTIQLYKTDSGSFQTPCYVTLWVWLDMELRENTAGGDDDWFSFATFCSDDSDSWKRTVLVNLNHEGYVHLMHVPTQGEQEHIFQTDEISFPQREWVELKVYLDFSKDGYAKVWQNGELVSHALVDDVDNVLHQAHFGLYCPPEMTSGVVYNDDLKIEMVNGKR